MRTVARVAARLVLITLAFAVIFPIAHALLVAPPDPPPVQLAPPPAGQYTIHVTDWGYHTSITIPQVAGWRLGPAGREGAAYVEYAWGDRRFYRDSDFRPHSVFATLFLPTASVTYIAGRDRAPTRAAGARSVHAREIDAATLHALVMELERTIRHDRDGARTTPGVAAPGYSGRFHDAHGSYLWTRNCNRWTVDRLAAVGLAERATFVVFSGQVAGRLRGFLPS